MKFLAADMYCKYTRPISLYTLIYYVFVTYKIASALVRFEASIYTVNGILALASQTDDRRRSAYVLFYIYLVLTPFTYTHIPYTTLYLWLLSWTRTFHLIVNIVKTYTRSTCVAAFLLVCPFKLLYKNINVTVYAIVPCVDGAVMYINVK